MELIYERRTPDLDAATAMARAVEYLQGQGYVSHAPNRLRRGSLWHAIITGAVQRIPSQVAVSVETVGNGVNLTVRYDLRTTGQFITETNRRYWDVEIEELSNRLASTPQEDPWPAYWVEARRDNRRFLIVSLGLAVVGAVVAVALRLWTLR